MSTQQLHQIARHSRHTRERITRQCFRERHTFARAVETLVNPTEEGARSRITATLQSFQRWHETHTKLLKKENSALFALEGAGAGQQQ